MAFLKGVSGNLAGRPKGNATAAKLRSKIFKELPEIIDTLLENAKKGDMAAIKLLIDRALPPLKARDEPIKFNVADGADTVAIAREVVSQMANGHINPSDANAVMSALDHQCKIVDVVELSQRIGDLEKRLGK